VFAGALGGLGHALRSIYWYIGNRELVWSWLAMYVFLPIHGATLAIIFYLVIRGGFFSPQSTVSDTSPFGFAAVAVLIGMFTSQASEKLREIAETVLAKPPQGKNPALPPPRVTGIEPTQGSMAGGEAVKITGTGFAKGATVKFGGQLAKDVAVADDEKAITAVTPPSPQPGQVSVEVINPDNQSVSFTGFTYQSQALPVPKVTGIEPSRGATAGGTSVTITGTGFVAETQVNFGGKAAQSVTFQSETTLVATTPPGDAAGAVPVEVINPGNQKDASKTFIYDAGE
jgi:IPT/TIG domain-containing protein